MQQIDEIAPPWQAIIKQDLTACWAGEIENWESISALHAATSTAQIQELVEKFLVGQNSCFGLIVETPNFFFALVDHIRSYPIFLLKGPVGPVLCTDVRSQFFQSSTQDSQDPLRTEEFLLCGYVPREATLFKNITMLQAGQSVTIEKRNQKTRFLRHFRYFPGNPTSLSAGQLITQFNNLLDNVFERVCSRAKGKPIWVPLSGGLDSRLILCKLVEHNYHNITAFSYGLNHNSDMERAKVVAKELGVRWIRCPSKVNQLTSLYASKERKAYTDYAWGAHAVPVWMDFEAINYLRGHQLLPHDSLMINGYSGDFLFGGHIPTVLTSQPTISTLISLIISKHCSHFESSKLNNAQARIIRGIKEELDELVDPSTSDVESLCSFYEYWDWQERQAKAVVNGQRLYDHLGLKWALPLWDKTLVDFWMRVPLDLRYGQRLHIEYLQQYNFRNQFRSLRSRDQLWPPLLRWLPVFGKLLELLSSRKVKLYFYDSMYFFGFHRFQLGLFGASRYRQTHKFLRRPYVVPIAAIEQLEDLSLSYPEGLFEHSSL